MKYDIFNQREIIVDGKSFPNICQAAKAFGLKHYSLQYALRNEKTEIQRPSDGKVFSISSRKILNKHIQRKMNELHERFQIAKLDYCPPHAFKEMYEKFCKDLKKIMVKIMNQKLKKNQKIFWNPNFNSFFIHHLGLKKLKIML